MLLPTRNPIWDDSSPTGLFRHSFIQSITKKALADSYIIIIFVTETLYVVIMPHGIVCLFHIPNDFCSMFALVFLLLKKGDTRCHAAVHYC